MEQTDFLPSGRLTREAILARFSSRGAPGTRGLGLPLGASAPTRGDHMLTPGAEPPGHPLTPAAVLVGLVERPLGATVLLTQRTDHLTDHAGQISFPGGRIEPTDVDPLAAALREAEEEVGLTPSHVEPIGRLDTYLTSTGFEITPIVGLIRVPYPLNPDPFEVAEVFEVPLDFILDPANHQRQSRELKGRTRHFFVLPYEHRYIWGATAAMLVNLAEVLTAQR
jgi:8-oxo-dGTP pyrophosphatase MutT (NUDIX family)